MRNISYHGKIELNASKSEEEVEFGGLGRPQINILADGVYEIYVSATNPGKLIRLLGDKTLSGNQMISWDFIAANEIKYLLIKMISGTFVEADIRVCSWGRIN